MSASSWSARYGLNVRRSITSWAKRVNVDEAGVATVYRERIFDAEDMETKFIDALQTTQDEIGSENGRSHY